MCVQFRGLSVNEAILIFTCIYAAKNRFYILDSTKDRKHQYKNYILHFTIK